MPYSVKGFFEINEDMVQILLIWRYFLHRILRLKICSVVLLPALNPAFSNYFFSLGFKPIQDDSQHDFARMTDEADSSVVLAELQVALFRECNNQRLSPWGRPFSCSPDSVTDSLCLEKSYCRIRDFLKDCFMKNSEGLRYC